jgi:septum formation protein
VIVLASGSPQRRAILEQLGIEFRVQVPEVEEIADGEPRAVVIENALRKARSVAGPTVLGVDTAVVMDDRLLGKPRDEAQAGEFLAGLSGRSHQVWSGLAVIDASGERTAAAVTHVRIRPLGRPAVDRYVATGEWRGRAGGYAIQGQGAALVEGIEGDYLNVVGLPVAALVRVAPELLGGP